MSLAVDASVACKWFVEEVGSADAMTLDIKTQEWESAA